MVKEYDVIIIGAGAAGMMAALTLAGEGRSCVILERGNALSTSNGARAGGPSLADTRLQEAAGCTVTAEQLYQHMFQFSRGTVNGGLLYNCVKRGRKAEALFRECGIQMSLTEDLYGVGFRARHFFDTPAPKRWAKLYEKLKVYGGEIRLHTKAVELLYENQRICGVLAEDNIDGTRMSYYGQNVIIATGGYLGNSNMVKEQFGEIHLGVLGNKLSDGTGIRMVLDAGGVKDRNWGICAGEFGGYHHHMKKRFPGNMRWAMTGGLLVDREGKRFMNEQYLADEPLSAGGEISLREGLFYAVIDEAFYQGIRSARSVYDFYGRPDSWTAGKAAHAREGYPFKENLDEDVKEGWALRCEQLREAAEYFHLPRLEESVAEYNRMCRSGADRVFGKSGYLLKPIEKAPFYVFAYEPSAWCTLGGVKTDSFCRALTPQQTPIVGLYVAGVDNGSGYCVPYYDTEGACLGIAFTSGIVAAEHILASANSV